MPLDPTVSEWLNLILRWTHVFAGIMWVGTTYYFTWLDARLTEEEKAAVNTGNAAQVWMVHSGGFYVVERRKVPDLVSRTLHWFKWEAGTTWLSGFALLIVLYYLGGGALIDHDVRDIYLGAAVGVGIAVVVVGWRLGTIMAANVWMRIRPAQKKMIAALKEGRKPDERLAAQAKLRSKQNTFMAVPVVFIMISNHFPGVSYGERYNWAILAVLVLAGWIAAKFIRRA